MPQNKRSLKRHQRTCVLRNAARCVVANRATRWKRSTVSGTRRSDQAFASIHGVPDWFLLVLRLRVQFDPHGIGIEITKKNLNVK